MSSTFSIRLPFIELQRVESTNNYATGLIHAGMAHDGTAVFAHDQTRGKGQRNKQWHSEAGKNIALSVILKPHRLSWSQTFLLSMATAVAVYRFFCKYAGEETKIKWPNDIYWRDRKAAGILIENTVQGVEWKWAVAGIGININQTYFSDDIAIKATSLKQITGKNFEPLVLARELCQCLTEAYNELHQSENDIINAYKKNLFGINETVLFKKGPRVFNATVKDVTRDGRLVLQTAVEESFEVGEIEWLI